MNRDTLGESTTKFKVLLVDVDSKIPNLALMKLSSYHKWLGHEVGFNVSEPNLILASVIMKKNAHHVDGLKAFYPDAYIKVGGPGYDLNLKLDETVENMRPDYDLYPGMNYSMGFTTRGCIRNCYFCVVPKKEGKLVQAQHPRAFHDPQFNEIYILDNNWMADRDWFFETSQWIIDQGLKLRENGLDIRLLDDELAEQLSKFKLASPLHFAFDSEKDLEAVVSGIDMLKAHGIDTKNKTSFYVYCHDDSQYESALYRCNVLKEERASAFLMFNCDKPRTDRIKHLQRWANKPWLFWSIEADQFTYSSKKWKVKA